MKKFETPLDFEIKLQIDNYNIEYLNLKEFSQGSPEIGELKINNIQIEGYQFGGPILHKDSYIYIPIYKRNFLSSGFILTRINLETLKIEELSNVKRLIFLDRIKENRVYFFEDINKSKECFLILGNV